MKGVRSLGAPFVVGWSRAEAPAEPADAERRVVEVYDRMRPALLAYAHRLVGYADAEDVVQAAFLRLHGQIVGGAAIGDLRAWLYRVVHNQAIDVLRRQRRQEWLAESWARQPLPGLAPSAEDATLRRQAVSAALAALNERERHCLLLRAEGLSYREIAGVLGTSPKSVSVYLARGLRKLGACS